MDTMKNLEETILDVHNGKYRIKNRIKAVSEKVLDALQYVAAWICIGLFYIMLYVCFAIEEIKHAYYFTFRIPYYRIDDKFGCRYIRLDDEDK